jgi:DNA-binding NarL/FixJ family response regulator
VPAVVYSAAVAAEALAFGSSPPAARCASVAAAPEALPAREREVAALIGQGMTSKEIAAWAVRHGLSAAIRPA